MEWIRMTKQNCWEFKNCGRESGGAKVPELGVCPSATDASSNGLNGGKNGGRICWSVAGTLCGGKVQGSFTEKHFSCITCDFFKMIKEQESKDFLLLKPGQEYKPHQ